MTASAQEIIFDVGATAELAQAVDSFGWQRLFICASGSGRRAGHLAAIAEALGDRLVGTYDGVRPHVPAYQVAEAVAEAIRHDCDAVVGLGGGRWVTRSTPIRSALCGRC